MIDTECDERHLNKITYANGDHISYEYDEKNRVVAVKENGDDPSVTITYADTARDSIRILHACGVDYQRNVINQKLITTEEIVCFNEEITKKQLKTTGIAKSSDGSTTIFDRYFGDEVIPFERVVTRYDKNGLPIVLSRTNHGETIGYQYDSLYRVEQKTSKCVSESGEKAFVTYYGYETISGNRKSPRICTEKTIGVGDTKEYKYSYYANGNLSEIRLNGTLLNKYRYDEYSRIIEEGNHELGSAFRYEYDSAGNIICKKKYEILNGVVQSVVESTAIYDYMTVNVECGHNAAWKDQLKRYNGDVISYDASGNPLNYFGKTFAWQGRKLIKVNSVEMAYDYNGLRVKKGDKRFYWQNGNLIAELWKENETEKFIYYFYDESGVCGFYYEGQEYHYYKNIFGDVLAVYAANGDFLCRYVYDAWGNHMVYDATGNNVTSRGNCIENINPFRYRGYYWDEEFGLYYLQSRYYDPVTGIFISPDSLKYLDPESVSGMNLYAYCGNDPVNNNDHSGCFYEIAFAVFLIVSVAATVNDIYQIASKNIEATVTNNGTNINVKDSYKVLTPWGQWVYSFYLNHLNPETKDVIKGSSIGVQYEWMLHNIAYDVGINRKSSRSVDVGYSIFSDSHGGIMGNGMKISYILLHAPAFWVWDLFANGGFGKW